MLFVLQPLAYIHRSVCVNIGALIVGLVFNPFALINISIGVDQSTVPIRHVVAPETFVVGSILPDLPPTAVAFSILPLTRVDCPVLELYI